jgi:hypothetical protein
LEESGVVLLGIAEAREVTLSDASGQMPVAFAVGHNEEGFHGAGKAVDVEGGVNDQLVVGWPSLICRGQIHVLK